MSFADITAAFENHIKTLPLDIEVEYENIKYKPKSVEYLRITVLQGDIIQACLGRQGQDLSVGFCQVDVFTPIGSGRTTVPDSVADHYYRQPIAQGDIVVEILNVSQGPKIKSQNYMQTPVTIDYRVNSDARN